MANLTFYVGYSSTLEGVDTSSLSMNIYTEDLNLCQACVDITNSCWSCLITTQQVFSDSSLTTIVNDGYYFLYYDNGSTATWYIVDGYPQTAGFHN